MTFIDYLTDMNVMPGEDEFMKKNSVKKFLVSILAVTTMFGTSVSTSVALNGKNTATNGANLLDELTAGETISTKLEPFPFMLFSKAFRIAFFVLRMAATVCTACRVT